MGFANFNLLSTPFFFLKKKKRSILSKATIFNEKSAFDQGHETLSLLYYYDCSIDSQYNRIKYQGSVEERMGE